jgi:predicted nucleic acid-binding protein
MPVPTFYLETSVWGSLAPHQLRDRKRVVQRLLSLLDGVRGVCVISEVVRDEIELASPNAALAIRRRIETVQPEVRPVADEARSLALAYIAASVLPDRRRADALHVAVATFHSLDFLVSWNHRHLTRPLKKLQFEAVNRLHGFWKTPLICNPWEACNELQRRG